MDQQQLIEFEGLTKICFSTKNKMMRAIFSLHGVQNMMLQNYELVHKAVLEKPALKTLVMECLVENDIEEQRPAKMTVVQFLELLQSLRKRGLYVC